VQGNDTSRVAPIKALLHAGVDVRVYGNEEQWASVGVVSSGVCGGCGCVCVYIYTHIYKHVLAHICINICMFICM